MFQGESSSSSVGDSSSQSLIAKANKMIAGLRSDPLARTERHTKHKKRKRGTSRGTWCREFQRNLVVIEFQGKDVTPYRTLRDYENIYEGVITLNSSMTEEDVRSEIVSLVRCKKSMFHSLNDLAEDDIQFIKCANRRVRVPDGTIVCNGDGIKQLYRSGAVYVRLTRSFSKVWLAVAVSFLPLLFFYVL